MLILVHEMRHHWQDMVGYATDDECDAYEVEREYAVLHGYPSNGILHLMQRLGCRIGYRLPMPLQPLPLPLQWETN